MRVGVEGVGEWEGASLIPPSNPLPKPAVFPGGQRKGWLIQHTGRRKVLVGSGGDAAVPTWYRHVPCMVHGLGVLATSATPPVLA